MKHSEIKTRVMGYFDKYPDRDHTIKKLREHFNDVKDANLQYHLGSLIDVEFIIRPKQGIYRKNPGYKSVEQKRAEVTLHLTSGNGRVHSGTAWMPGDEPMKLVENPVMINFLGQTFGNSIIERMSASGFTPTEVRFITKIVAEKYPLTEQQRITMERVAKV